MPDMNQEGGQVPPEIQNQFDMFVINGMEIIHDPKVTDGILNRLQKGGDPIRGIAEATVDIVNRLSESATENGIQMANEVLVHGSNVLMGEIMNITEVAGMEPLTEEQKTQSFQLATSLYLDNAVKSGKMTPEQMEQLSQQTQQAQPEFAAKVSGGQGQPGRGQGPGGGQGPTPGQGPRQGQGPGQGILNRGGA